MDDKGFSILSSESQAYFLQSYTWAGSKRIRCQCKRRVGGNRTSASHPGQNLHAAERHRAVADVPRVGSSPGTHLELKQWAAVTTHSLARTAPPQTCSSETCTLTCHGHEYGTASSPPIILLKMNLGWFEGIPQTPSGTESTDVSRSLQRLRFGEAKDSLFSELAHSPQASPLPFFAKYLSFPHYKGSKCLEAAWENVLSKKQSFSKLTATASLQKSGPQTYNESRSP